MNNLIAVNDVQRMAEAVAKSGLFGVKSPEQAMALMLVAQAEGLHPATAARDYHVIQGRPALKTDAMMARFQQAGGKVEWKVYTDECVTGIFSHPQGGTLELSWTIEQAKRIGLAGKDNWKNYPRAMLRARVISEGIRTVFPGCVIGVYTPEEVQDFNPAPSEKEVKGEVVEEPSPEVKLKRYVLQIPGKEECPSFDTKEEWIAEFFGIANRVMKSAKMDNNTKIAKINELKRVNDGALTKVGTVDNIKIHAELKKMEKELNNVSDEE